MAYSEEILKNVTITHTGSKQIQTVTVTLKDGVEVGRANHRSVIAPDEDVPADIAAHIEAKKGKQPKKGTV